MHFLVILGFELGPALAEQTLYHLSHTSNSSMCIFKFPFNFICVLHAYYWVSLTSLVIKTNKKIIVASPAPNSVFQLLELIILTTDPPRPEEYDFNCLIF
jgi:hypothetical protein